MSPDACRWWGGHLEIKGPHQVFPQPPRDCFISGSEFLSRIKVVNQVALFVLEMYLLLWVPLLVSAWLEALPAIIMWLLENFKFCGMWIIVSSGSWCHLSLWLMWAEGWGCEWKMCSILRSAIVTLSPLSYRMKSPRIHTLLSSFMALVLPSLFIPFARCGVTRVFHVQWSAQCPENWIKCHPCPAGSMCVHALPISHMHTHTLRQGPLLV